MPTRLIREGWLESEAINQLDPQSERFFLRLILRADDYGRFHANPILLKSALFPLREDVRGADITRWLAACEKSGMVRCYSDSAKPYLEITKFGQRARADKSKFPDPPESANVPLLPGMALSDGIGPRRNAGPMSGICRASDGHPQPYAESKTKFNLAPPAPPDVARENLLDALAKAEGLDRAKLTKSHARRNEVALSEIMEAEPCLTPERIARAAKEYPRVMPDRSKITAHALAKNWARCQGVKPVAAPVAVEPASWRLRLEAAFPGNLVIAEARPWSSVTADVWSKVLEHEARHGRKTA